MITAAELPQAEREAVGSADRASVEIRELDSAADMSEAAEVLRTIWRTAPDQSLLHPSLLVALSHGGSYVVGAFRGTRMIGVCVAFFSAPPGQSLHSHIAGVLPEYAGQGVGTALKLHQRLWCLRRDVQLITWTFDPLIARNASFNLHRLGATVRGYRADFYGAMTDGVNDGQPTDRLVVGWDLQGGPRAAPDAAGFEPAVIIGEDGGPVEAAGGPAAFTETMTTARLAVPDDVEALRRKDPDAARGWRLVIRNWLGRLLDAGWSVVGFDRNDGYLLTRR